MEPLEAFARNLRRARTRVGLSQEELGYASGLHRTQISLLERRLRSPRLSTIIRLARALGVEPSELLAGVR